MASEELWRSALHDLNNLMAGLQGVLDLSDPERPLDPRNRLRLVATLEDGKGLIAMARALALDRLPEAGLAAWPDWAAGLRERLDLMGELFRCPVELVGLRPGAEPWPTPLLQDWAAAFTRQILPWAAPGPLVLEAEASAEAWTLRWITDAPLPRALLPDPPPDAPRNLASIWLRALAERLAIEVEAGPGHLQARLPRPASGPEALFR